MPKVQATKPKIWHVYVLRCADDTLYCGITNDLERRLKQHNAGTGARYTRARLPVEIEGAWSEKSRSEALKAEYAFKRLTRAQKEAKLSAIKKAAKPTKRPIRKKTNGSA